MKNNGGAAFPLIVERGAESQVWEGISIRDYFAGQALAGSLSASNLTDYANKEQAERFAEEAYRFADSMLAEREKENA